MKDEGAVGDGFLGAMRFSRCAGGEEGDRTGRWEAPVLSPPAYLSRQVLESRRHEREPPGDKRFAINVRRKFRDNNALRIRWSCGGLPEKRGIRKGQLVMIWRLKGLSVPKGDGGCAIF